MIALVLPIAAGYLIGSISPGVVAARRRGVDLRRSGSGGTGFTNASRQLGWRIGVLVLVVDVAKGALAAAAGLILAGAPGGAVAAVAAVCGHVWPLFDGFRGGKGVAVSLGAFAVLCPGVALMAVAIHGAITVLSGYVSLASIAVAALLPVLLVVAGGQAMDAVCGIGIAAIVIWAHRGNITRLRNRAEPRMNSIGGGIRG